MGIIGFLIGFPLLIALVMLVVKDDRVRRGVVIVSVAVIALASIVFAVLHLTASRIEFDFAFGSSLVTYFTLAVDVAICAYIVVQGVRHKRPWVIVLALAQTLTILVYELFFAHDIVVRTSLYIDTLSAIMVLVIGIIGGAICIYALGYMEDHVEHHPEQADRRPVFFALLFVFLAAMFGIVVTNNLCWLLCVWEVTTVCSFALIGYTRTQEAVDNSFRQIWMNMLGGLAFAVAIVISGTFLGTLELDRLVAFGGYGIGLAPVALLAFAALTKAAQMPFQTWLLGAMVAPTPVSALLHSSTMVKAGVFLLIKLAPAFGWNVVGIMVMLVGGFTFLACSCMAITQSNAKRVLAYSTIANLGLIAACAGVGTAGAVWAAIFLLVFHAVAKSLLFLCVGTAEHHIGSRDIEDMDGLFTAMPRLARLMAIGILCMFIAPFGMLVSKWAALVSVIDSGNIVLLLLLVFGSAVTFMFWAKWLGKVTAVACGHDDVEGTVHATEWFPLVSMAVLALALCVAFPFCSLHVVAPYLSTLFGAATAATVGVGYDNLFIMSIIVLAVIILALGFFGRSNKRKVDIYLSGVATDADPRSFTNSLSGTTASTQRNWYMTSIFGEARIAPVGNWVCIILLAAGIVLSALGVGGVV